MTRHDYTLLAVSLKEAEPQYLFQHEGWLAAVKAVAVALARDNPRFDRQVFLKACGAA